MPFIFNIDKTTVTEGETVEIRWDCSGAETTNLIIDNGFKSSCMNVENTGNKKFRLNRSKGKTKLILEATFQGKKQCKEIRVRIKKLKTTRTRTINNEAYARQREEFSKKNLNEKWHILKNSIRYSWQCLPENKRLAYKILGILLLIVLLIRISPRLVSLGLLILAGYLFFVIVKK